jgi:hypothetical protein
MFVFLAAGTPAAAQVLDDPTRDLPLGAQYAFGNLALREVIRDNEPVQQFKNFFAGVKLPLSRDQERELDKLIEVQRKDWQALVDKSGEENPPAETARKLNQDFVRKVNGVLTVEQQNEWRHYRIEQFRLRGGFPALKAILEDAQLPLTVDQEKTIERIFENFARRRQQLPESNSRSADSDRLVLAEFNRVVALLSTEQRRALMTSRPRAGSVAPPRPAR